MKIPKKFAGGVAKDKRGIVTFNNNIILKNIKRFYTVQNKTKNFVRAWHGHKIEAKYIICISGKAKICAVKINNYNIPSKKNKPYKFELDGKKPDIIYIPPGYANGSKSLTKNMKLLILSTSTLNKSIKDDFRYPASYWRI